MKREKMSKFLSTHVKVLCNVLAGLVQLVLVQDDVKHLRRTLGQLLGRHQLDVDVTRLSLETILIKKQLYVKLYQRRFKFVL